MTLKLRTALVVAIWLTSFVPAFAQQAYFVDGYHGGIYGHYPEMVTQFMVDQMAKHPDWKLCLEIEPDTWEMARTKTPEAYAAFIALVNDPKTKDRIEFVNPSFGQSYFWNIPGESVIRQFTVGIEKTREHFPDVEFVTYSSEEPCFTSALPAILKSLGFRQAVLKNPNTCWGGYTSAFGGELVDWVGPDGTRMPTVPRYESEALRKEKTWETTASRNGPEYIGPALAQGIRNPVGMCLQDAGWRNGPWLKAMDNVYQPTRYVTWREYFDEIAIKQPEQDWRFSQEDVLVSLVWGSQVMQRIAQQTRNTENQLIQAEKLASLARLQHGQAWPGESFATAWPKLLLAQHHDCWIVPYNGRRGNTWADKVVRWTSDADQLCDDVRTQSLKTLSSSSDSAAPGGVLVVNTLGRTRQEVVEAPIPSGWSAKTIQVLDPAGKQVPAQIVAAAEGENGNRVVFLADAPAFGQAVFQFVEQESASAPGAQVALSDDGVCTIETDLYRIVLDGTRGGTIRSLKVKSASNAEWVDADHERRFGELRGFFRDEQKFLSSADQPAKIDVLESGPVRVRVRIAGAIGKHPFVQDLTVVQGEPRIDHQLTLNWEGDPGIGDDYAQESGWKAEDPRKAFYDDAPKLLALFPANFLDRAIFKDSAFDVTESRLQDTFFQTWDAIKHNLILNWVDEYSAAENRGLALLTDHTTTYVQGENHPLGLTLQYSGKGLWGRDHRITGPITIRYALVPHQGAWDEAGLASACDAWNEPLVATPCVVPDEATSRTRSLVDLGDSGLSLVSAVFDGDDLIVRLFNGEGNADPATVSLGVTADRAEWIELNGTVTGAASLAVDAEGGSTLEAAMPRFAFRTLRLHQARSAP